MAAIRTFNKMITKSLLGDDISDNSDNEFRFAADHRHVVTEESGPVTAAPADDEGGFTLMGFSLVMSTERHFGFAFLDVKIKAELFNIHCASFPLFCFVLIGSPSYQWGCTIAAVSAHQPA